MSAETKRIRAACLARAGESCECGCQRFLGEDAQMDHQAGRGRARQTVENCWMLTAHCHEQRTLNKPSAAWWLRAYASHCARWNYSHEHERAIARLQFVAARGAA